jgi:hypothetical protein
VAYTVPLTPAVVVAEPATLADAVDGAIRTVEQTAAARSAARARWA